METAEIYCSAKCAMGGHPMGTQKKKKCKILFHWWLTLMLMVCKNCYSRAFRTKCPSPNGKERKNPTKTVLFSCIVTLTF